MAICIAFIPLYIRLELQLLSIVEIGYHEQTRLQPEIAESLNTALVDPEHVKQFVSNFHYKQGKFLLENCKVDIILPFPKSLKILLLLYILLADILSHSLHSESKVPGRQAAR